MVDTPAERVHGILRAVNHKIYQVERLVAGGLFLTMTLVVALSVVHRVFSREEGRLSLALLKLLQRMGFSPEPSFIHGPISLGINFAIGFGLASLAVRTVKTGKPWRRSHATSLALAVVALGAGCVWLVLALFPSGLVWGPAVALACMLWVGFLGASLATYENKHLALEMGEKLWPAQWQRPIKALAMCLTAGLCAFLALLACMSIGAHFAAWQVNPLTGHLLPTEIPKWTVFTVLPYTFAIMTLRFVGQAFTPLRRQQEAIS